MRESTFRINIRLSLSEGRDEFRNKILSVKRCVKSFPAAKGAPAELDKLNGELGRCVKEPRCLQLIF